MSRKAPGKKRGEEGHPIGLPLPAEVGKARSHPTLRLVPGDGVEMAVLVSGKGLSDPVGGIEPLKRSLPPGAEAALVHRMSRGPLPFNRPPFEGLHQHPAPRRTLPADGGKPAGHPWDE